MPNSRKSFSEKLDDLKDGLEEIPEAAAEGFHRQMERAEGEIWFRDDSAPDREMFAPDESGYRRFLEECHEWAMRDFERAVNGLHAAVDGVDPHDVPEPGDISADAEDARELVDESILTAKQALADVEEARARLDKIERAFRDI